jgi:hypothetical protein
MDTRCLSRAVLAMLALAAIPSGAWAQGRPFARLLLSVGQGYDDNLFASPASGNPQSDFVTRFGPVFEGGYNSPALSLLAHYGFDAERYIDRVELDKNLARQDALVDFNYRPGPRVALRIDGSYLDTQTPRELNVATLLPAGRARAQRTRGHSGLIFDANAVMKVTADYELAQDDIVGSLVTTTQTSRLGVSYRPTARTTYRSEYRFSHLSFGDNERMYSVAMTGGWARSLTQSLTLELDAGPRVTLGEIRPELAAQLKRRLRRGEVLIAYFATEDTALGEIGTIQVQRLLGTLTYTPWRNVTLRATPATARSLRGASTPVTVHEVAGDVEIRANSKLAFVAAGHFGQQNGTFNGSRDLIPYRGVSIKSVVTLQ